MGGKAFKPGDTWHCLEHGGLDVKVIAEKPATLKEQEELTQ